MNFFKNNRTIIYLTFIMVLIIHLYTTIFIEQINSIKEDNLQNIREISKIREDEKENITMLQDEIKELKTQIENTKHSVTNNTFINNEWILQPLYTKHSSEKNYEDYRCITDKTSPQYSYLKKLNICDDGLLRTSDNYIAVALGTAYGDIGSKFMVVLDNKKTFFVVKCDEKDDKHTDENNAFNPWNNSMIEFIVDTDNIPNKVKNSGDFNSLDEFSGTITALYKMQ